MTSLEEMLVSFFTGCHLLADIVNQQGSEVNGQYFIRWDITAQRTTERYCLLFGRPPRMKQNQFNARAGGEVVRPWVVSMALVSNRHKSRLALSVLPYFSTNQSG